MSAQQLLNVRMRKLAEEMTFLTYYRRNGKKSSNATSALGQNAQQQKRQHTAVLRVDMSHSEETGKNCSIEAQQLVFFVLGNSLTERYRAFLWI